MIVIPDITMCSSENCPQKNFCYRATAKPSMMQSWSNFEYECNENSGFSEFIKIENFNKNIQIKDE